MPATPARRAMLLAAALTVPLLAATPTLAAPLTSPVTAPVASTPGAFVAVNPSRVLDTRQSSALAAGSRRTVSIAGHAGVPGTGAGAVEVSVVALTPAGSGTVTVAPGGSSATASSLSYTTGRSAAGTVVTALSGGAITLRNNGSRAVQLVLDVGGYYLAGAPTASGTTTVTAPQRLADTRSGLDVRSGPVRAGSTVTLPVLGHAGVPASGVAAVLVNLTAVSPTATGSLTAFAGGTRPNVVSGSFVAGGSSSTLAQVRVGANGAIVVGVNGSGSTQLVADVEGYVLSGAGTAAGVDTSIAPARFLDTRSGLGGAAAPVRASSATSFLVAGRGGVASTGVAAAVVSLTAIAPQADGNLSVSADGSSASVSTTVAFAAGRSSTALIIAPVGPDGRVLVHNNSPGSVQIVADVAGWIRSDPTSITTSTSRYVRDLQTTNTDADNAAVMRQHGTDDAAQAAPGAQYLSVLDLGAQFLENTSTYGIQLTGSAGTRLPDNRIVAALAGYLDGFATARANTAPAMIVIATNNDSHTALDSNAGRNFGGLINQLNQQIAGHAGQDGWANLQVVGGNDIEPDFVGTEAQAESWTKGYLAVSSAPYVFLGAASGCPTTGKPGGTCNFKWTAAQFYRLAHGLAPTRIFALPQIYVAGLAKQWEGIDLTGASGADRITFIGALTESEACQQAGDCNGFLSPAEARSQLAAALASSPATSQQRLPVSTDLRIDAGA